MSDFLTVNSGDVKEGFLCPICMKDLGDVLQLQVHFEDEHSKEDPVFLQNIKDLFGKAKKKILNKDGELSIGVLNTSSSGGGGGSGDASFSALASAVGQEAKAIFGAGSCTVDLDPVTGVHAEYDFAPRPRVAIANHTDFFKRERKRKLDRNKSTNQVLVRLEKLLKDLPADPVKRRAHEQATVPWIAEDLVKLCPTCAKSFNIKRRKHHCRLCGCIMCGDCSSSVHFDFAHRVLNPASISKFQPPPAEAAEREEERSSARDASPTKKGLFKSKLSGSHESLNSIMSMMEQRMTEPQFRTCRLCRDILEAQDRRAQAADGRDHLVAQFFERLQAHKREGAEQAAAYRDAVESLRGGQEDHDLREAKMQRVKLLRIAENIDIMSKKIAALNTEPDSPRPAAGIQLLLQQRIRQDAVNFVKATLVGLPDVPSEDEFQVLRSRRVANAEARVEEERQAARMAKLRVEQEAAKKSRSSILNASSSSPAFSRNSPASRAGPDRSSVNYGSGFVLTSSASNLTSSDDPMVQQIRNIREYIKEARRLNRADEVAALEANLRDLQEEYRRSQRERKELEENYDSFKSMFHKHSPSKAAGGNPGNGTGEESQASPGVAERQEESREVQQEYVDIDEYDASGKNPFFDE